MHRRLSVRGVGFTLIELLIVVAIIAILAAIAVPNFLEAQTRSKVARIKADFRSLATALECYATDNNHFPPSYAVGNVTGTVQFELSLPELSTPVAYMTSISIADPFNQNERVSQTGQTRPLLMYFNYEVLKPQEKFGPETGPKAGWRDWASTTAGARPQYPKSHRTFSLWSPGTDKNDDGLFYIEMDAKTDPNYYNNGMIRIYDPTNGTVSKGDIMRLGSGALAVRLPVDGASAK